MVESPTNIEWNTPAGRLIDQLLDVLPSGQDVLITIFGSGALQMVFGDKDRRVLSQDVDIYANRDIEAIIHQHKLDTETKYPPPGIRPCSELSFRATPNWQDRALVISRKGHRVRLPHPTDILISKLPRLEEKDIEAFVIVREKTGHPDEAELVNELPKAVDLYNRPPFDDEQPRIFPNTQELWRRIFGHDIDVRARIIKPALECRKSEYDHKGGISAEFGKEAL
jgi:hypothetical protein